ncbi:MAG TPA: hypothetical protein VK568_05115 [Thermodesulfobacteriota bacterium]|jgi:hypothetical protein|nr:hypothetical protein [Thermodesulfobacteriota bacterium]
MANRQIKKAKEGSLEEETLVSKPKHFFERTFAFIFTSESILCVEFLTLIGGLEFFRSLLRNLQNMINNIVPNVNPTLNTALPGISIEIRPEIIYVESI